MARDSVSQIAQIGLETTKGTLVAATKRFTSLGFAWNDPSDWSSNRPIGRKFATGTRRSRKRTELTGEGALNFNELTFILLSLIKTTTPVAGTAGETGSYTWTFTPSDFAPDDFKTFTFERGYPGGSGQRAGYGHCIGMEITSSKEDVSVSTDWLARNTIRGFTVTSGGGVTDIPDERVFGDYIDVSLDAAAGDIGDTILDDIYMSAWRFTGRRGSAYVMNSSYASWAHAPELAPTAEFDIRVENSATADALETAADTGVTKYLRYLVSGPLIVGTTDYMLQIDMACQVKNAGSPTDEQGIDSKLYTLEMVNDSDLGAPFEITLVNAMASAA